jgi:hypothetical protein
LFEGCRRSLGTGGDKRVLNIDGMSSDGRTYTEKKACAIAAFTVKLHGTESFLELYDIFTTQKIPRVLWNPEVRYCVYEILPLIPVLSQANPVHTQHVILSGICLSEL